MTVAPISFAVGVAVLLVGLIVSPLAIAPVGGGIAIAAGVAWVRRRKPRPEPPPRYEETRPERFGRKRLLERATLGLGGLVALGVALPAGGLALLPSFVGQKRKAIDLGPIAAFPEGQFVLATFLSDPEQGEVSRRAAFVRNNGLFGRASFTIMSNRCPHVGCPTQPNGPVFSGKRTRERTHTGEIGLVPTLPAGGFGCPCHGSQFDTEGNRTAGPAPRALDRYQFSIRNGRLWLDGLYSVGRVEDTGGNARIAAFKLRGDGEPVTGPESLLYPVDPLS